MPNFDNRFIFFASYGIEAYSYDVETVSGYKGISFVHDKEEPSNNRVFMSASQAKAYAKELTNQKKEKGKSEEPLGITDEHLDALDEILEWLLDPWNTNIECSPNYRLARELRNKLRDNLDDFHGGGTA